LEGYARSNIRLTPSTDHGSTYGVSMSRYVSGQGTINIVMHRDWNDSAVYGGYIFIVDMNNVRQRPLQNVGQTQLLRNRQAPDYDGVKDEYRSETGIQVIQERTHAVITGIT
jgi:hypothetical protein